MVNSNIATKSMVANTANLCHNQHLSSIYRPWSTMVKWRYAKVISISTCSPQWLMLGPATAGRLRSDGHGSYGRRWSHAGKRNGHGRLDSSRVATIFQPSLLALGDESKVIDLARRIPKPVKCWDLARLSYWKESRPSTRWLASGVSLGSAWVHRSGVAPTGIGLLTAGFIAGCAENQSTNTSHGRFSK